MLIIQNDLDTDVPENIMQNGNYIGVTCSPNPASSIINLTCNLPEQCDIKIEFYNQTGVLVKKTIDNSRAAGQYSQDMDISDLPEGVYFYSVWASAIKSNHIYRGSGKVIVE